MKIIGKTHAGYLIEASEDEIAKAAGYGGDYDGEWKSARPAPHQGGWGDSRSSLIIGSEIDVRAAHDFHSRIKRNEAQARSAAGILKAIAELIEGNLPGVVIPPAVIEAEGATNAG
ncbi:hypothetical protein EOA24_00605 [Mesorhizobium sp. M2A.F.Ca.ET.039.01.1.1]|nr:hypothetical protein EOA24_00605 [Mesorhizobium sp. M2A.F.Ca.ET.039.01.1.1]